MVIRGIFLLSILISGAACTRPSRTASLTVQMPSVSSPHFSQRLSAATAIGTSAASWGNGPATVAGNINCFAVVVGDASTGSNQCVQTNDSIFSFSKFAGFIAKGSTASLELEPGTRTIRVLATSVPGDICPTLTNLDTADMAQMRVVASTTVDLVAGENNIAMTMNMSGPLVDRCSGTDIASPPAPKCNFLRSAVRSLPGIYSTTSAIVMLKKNASSSAFLASLPADLSANIVGTWNHIDAYHVDFSSSVGAAWDLSRLCEGKDVSFVEPVVTAHPPASYYASNAPSVSAGMTVVAQLDTGIDASHSVFSGTDSLLTGYNFDGNSGDYADDADHGTSMAGMILAGAGVDITASPTSSPIKILPYRVTDNVGDGAMASVATAVLSAVDAGAAVIYLGIGSSESLLFKRALYYAMSNGVPVVTPAGNENRNVDQNPRFPGSWFLPLNINVGSTTATNSLSLFSDYGPASVHVGMQGTSMLTTKPSDTFGYVSGTTIAAAQVAGVLAKGKALRPELSAMQLRSLLFTTVQTDGKLDGKFMHPGVVSPTAFFSAVSAMVADNSAPSLTYPQ